MLRIPVISSLVVLACFILPANADPQSQARADAAYIVEQTVTAELFEAALDAISPMLVSSLDSEFRKGGVVASQDALSTLGLMMRQEMMALMVDQMQIGAIDLYVAQFSPEALAAYRSFLETPGGQEIAKGTPLLTRESAKLGEVIGARVGVESFQNILAAAKAGQWPEGTLASTQRELVDLLSR